MICYLFVQYVQEFALEFVHFGLGILHDLAMKKPAKTQKRLQPSVTSIRKQC